VVAVLTTAAFKAWIKRSTRATKILDPGFGSEGRIARPTRARAVRATAAERDRAADGADSVHIQLPVYLAVLKEGKTLSDFDFPNQNAKDMLNQLSWWTNALRAAREQTELRAA
jgi:hypothetical protein